MWRKNDVLIVLFTLSRSFNDVLRVIVSYYQCIMLFMSLLSYNHVLYIRTFARVRGGLSMKTARQIPAVDALDTAPLHGQL